MALSKPTFLLHLKSITKPHHLLRRHTPPPFPLSLRLLSFATLEEAAAERRKRKCRLRIEPPLSTHRHQQQAQSPKPPSSQNPNAPKLPEPISTLTGNRLNLHNKILKLIRENDLDEAALYTRHSVYSNCRPTIYTCNAVLTALLRQSKYSDLLSLHRFITQAGIAPKVGVSALPVNIIIGVIVVLGLGTALRLAMEFCHEWSVRRVVHRAEANVGLGYHPAL